MSKENRKDALTEFQFQNRTVEESIAELVMLSDEGKARLLVNPINKEHVEEFGSCVGILEGPVDYGDGSFGPEVNVRWLPSKLRYGYQRADLKTVHIALDKLLKAETNSKTEEMRKRSGQVKIKSKLVSFLYELIRDEVVPGKIEAIMNNCSNEECLYTNGWLAKYAEDLANRLKDD